MMPMHPIEYNLSLVDLMLDEFGNYILSSEVFWPLSKKRIGDWALPRLTLGGLMLTFDELAAQTPQMKSKQASYHERMTRTFDRLSQKWRVAIEKKASQELKARMNIWRAYLQDLEEQPRLIQDYPQEVRTRLMISHLLELLKSTPDSEDWIQAINHLDQRIDDFTIPGEFLWDNPLQQVYPKEKFPFLYRKPRSHLT
jgi:hypothetical protein